MLFLMHVRSTSEKNKYLVNVILGIFFIALPFWANFKHDPRILNIGLLLGFNFLMIQMEIIPLAVLSRNLEFKKLVKNL